MPIYAMSTWLKLERLDEHLGIEIRRAEEYDQVITLMEVGTAQVCVPCDSTHKTAMGRVAS